MPELPSTHYDLAGNPLPPPAAPAQPEPLPQQQINLEPRTTHRGRLVLILAAVFVLLAGIGWYVIFQPEFDFFDSNAPVTLTYWGIGIPPSVMQPVIDKYHDTHPNVTINYSEQSPTQYQQTLLTRLQQGTGPDIFRFHNTWTPVLKSELAPVTSRAYTNSDYAGTFYPTTKNDLYLNGRYYGIPISYDGLVLLYNANLLQANGFTGPPQTWSDVRSVYAPKLTTYNADGSIATSGIAIGTAGNVDYFSDIMGLLMLQNGVNMVSGGQVAFDKSLNGDRNLGADAVDFYTLFAKHDFSDKGSEWDGTLPPSMQAFAAGKVAMILVPEAKIAAISTQIAQSGHPFTMKVAAAPQAQPPSSARPVNWASYWVEGVSKRSKGSKAAWDFLKYLSSKDTELALYQAEAKLSGVGEAPSRVDLASSLSSDPIAGPVLSEASTGVSWYMTAGTLDQNVDDAMAGIFSNLIDSILTKNTPTAEALTNAATAASQVLARYGVVQSSAAAAANQP